MKTTNPINKNREVCNLLDDAAHHLKKANTNTYPPIVSHQRDIVENIQYAIAYLEAALESDDLDYYVRQLKEERGQ